MSLITESYTEKKNVNQRSSSQQETMIEDSIKNTFSYKKHLDQLEQLDADITLQQLLPTKKQLTL